MSGEVTGGPPPPGEPLPRDPLPGEPPPGAPSPSWPSPSWPPSGGYPAPPPGPGVQPPFVTAPTDGARQRRWVAAGLAGVAVLVVCLGGLFGLGALVVLGNRMLLEESRAAVTDYLTAIQQEDYTEAYDLLCSDQQARVTRSQFERSQRQARIVDFSVAEPVLSDMVVVPVRITYRDGSVRTVRYVVETSSSTGTFEVCGQLS